MAQPRPVKSLRIPKAWGDVRPGWMTAAIASHHPNARVSSVSLVNADDGTNRHARLGLEYSQGKGPATVFAKAHAPRHRWTHFRNGNLWNEAKLFRSGVPLAIEHPAVYASVVDYLGLDFLLVMEDLVARGADPRDATRPMTVDQVADGLRGLARLHSQYWGDVVPRTPQLRWMKTWKPTQGWQVGLRRFVPIGLERGAEAFPSEIMAMSGDAIVDIWARYVGTLTDGPMTLLHGDAHIGNVYVLPGDIVGFLDWQVVRRGAWHQDVGYFLVGALTTADRQTHEKELVNTYREALELPEAERPSVDETWLRYRASHAYGLTIWLSTLGTNGYQSQDISRALAERYAAAFLDHDTRSALDTVSA